MSMPVPKMTYVLPLRVRLQFTLNALPTILLNSSREHEVILVLDKCPAEYEFRRRKAEYPTADKDMASLVSSDRLGRERVYRWIDSHEALLKEYKVRVMDFHGDESCWTGGLRAAAAMNMGTAAGTTDWVVVFGDEDCVFRKDWDVALWEVIKDRDFMRFVSTPVMVMPRVHDEMTAPVPARRVTAEWIHAQRNRCCHQLTYPILAKHGELNSGRIYQETFESFAKTASLSGVHEESCGERRMCHWVPLIMHKQLFNKMGGYPTTDRAACSFDLVLDDTLRDMGVRKRMPLDHPMLHAKHFFRTNDEVDRVWGDKELLTTLGQEEV